MESADAANKVAESIGRHGKTSYYHAAPRLTEEERKLVESTAIAAGIDAAPKLLKVSAAERPAKKAYEVPTYDFLNDGPIVKAIVKLENLSFLDNKVDPTVTCEFGTSSFRLVIAGETSEYVLKLERTRENVVPEKCRHYLAKGKVYVVLHKEKEGDWWTLKGV